MYSNRRCVGFQKATGQGDQVLLLGNLSKDRKVQQRYVKRESLKLLLTKEAINIVTDFIYATLPVFMFYDIQVNRRTKASLMGILSLGYLWVYST